eukprot:scpid73839/ scgid25321/ 
MKTAKGSAPYTDCDQGVATGFALLSHRSILLLLLTIAVGIVMVAMPAYKSTQNIDVGLLRIRLRPGRPAAASAVGHTHRAVPNAGTHKPSAVLPKQPAPPASLAAAGSKCPKQHSALRQATNSPESVACPKDSTGNPSDKGELKLPVTTVTGYYRIRSKSPATVYMRWLGYFLHRIASPIAFYTNCETAPSLLEAMRKRGTLFRQRTHVEILELEDTPMARRFGAVLKQQESHDPERSIGHNYLLYLAWLMKTEALMATTRANPFCSEWFLWVDAGAFRSEHSLKNWPSPGRLKTIPTDRALFELVNPFSNTLNITGIPKGGNTGPFLQSNRQNIRQNHMAGGFIGLNVRSGFHLKFYSMLLDTYQTFIDLGFTITKDQSVFNGLFFLHPELFALVQSHWRCGDGWFHMEPWLAEKSEMKCELSPLLLLPHQ